MSNPRPHGPRLAVVASDGQRLPDLSGTAGDLDPGAGITLAVLPFAEPGGGDAQAFGEPLAEDVVVEFSRFQNVAVAPRGPTFACRAFADDTARVARQLGVQFVIEGTIRRGAERVRIGVRVLDGATGRLLASERFDWPAEDLLRSPEEVAQRITAGIAPEVDKASLQRAERLPPEALRVPDMALRARALLLRGAEAEDAEAIETGLALARRATEEDPRYAEAWRMLALAHCIRGERGAFGPSSRADYEAADAAAARLRALEPNGYAAHAIGGHVAMRQGRHAEALEGLRHARSLNPNAVTTLRWLSWEESNHGLAGPAREHAELSLRLSPKDHLAYLGHWALALALWVDGELEGCAEHVRRAVALIPHFAGYYLLLAACLAEQERLAEAAEAVARARRYGPGLLEARSPARPTSPSRGWPHATAPPSRAPRAPARPPPHRWPRMRRVRATRPCRPHSPR